MTELAEKLAKADRGFIIAPAGYGKTYQIAKAINFCCDGKQLILTHTHAGVRSINKKLKELGVSPKKYEVETIAGWSLRIAHYFPMLSSLLDFSPLDDDWKNVYGAITAILENNSIKKIIKATYKGIFVDEYQDCTLSQHVLMLNLAELLPCRILGDPLQGIFNFGKDDPIISFYNDVFPNFSNLGELSIPWRWNNANNSQLGDRLKILRKALEITHSFDLQKPPIKWIPKNPTNQLIECRRLLNRSQENVIAIHSCQNQCIAFAKKLKGHYTVMEKLNCEELMEAAVNIDNSQGCPRVINIINFASMCMTNITTTLRSAISSWEKGNLPTSKRNSELIISLNMVAINNSLSYVSEVLPMFRQIQDSYLFRRELWYEMQRTLRAHLRGSFSTLEETAWSIRNITREYGRKPDYHIVSRTLLVKGLEYDHGILLDADALDKNNLYVAMTRGSRTLTVLSTDPIIKR